MVEPGSSPRSSADVAAIVSTITGRRNNVAEEPTAAMTATLAGFGFRPDLPEPHREMMEALA